MSRVDVLAVMDEMRLAASEHYACRPIDLDTYAEARAAVAELMECANSVVLSYSATTFGLMSAGDIADLRAALAACRGDA